MKLGLVGLGKMGGNMRERLRRAGHEVVGYDTNPELADVPSGTNASVTAIMASVAQSWSSPTDTLPVTPTKARAQAPST